MDTPEVKKKLKEMHGIIAVAITKVLLLEPRKKPRHALAVFQLLSHIMLINGLDGKIETEITEYDLNTSFNKLVSRQQDKLKRTIIGFSDGETKLIRDKNIEGHMPLKEISINYIEKMRERYRDRERDERTHLL